MVLQSLVNSLSRASLYLKAQTGIRPSSFLTSGDASEERGSTNLIGFPLEVQEFFQACATGDTSTVNKLMAQGVDIDVVDSEERCPLTFACIADQKEVVKILLKANCYIDNPDNLGRTPLHWSCLLGKDKIVKTLLRAGADTTYSDHSSKTPVHLAVSADSIDALAEMLEHGCIVDPFDQEQLTPLMIACATNCPDHARYLLDYGADPTLSDANGKIPLHWATSNHSVKCVKYLAESYPHFIDIKDAEGRTALHIASSEGDATSAALLVKNGANVEEVDKGLRTPLHWAAVYGMLKVLEILLEKGARHHSKDINGATALHYAVQQSRDSIIEYLVSKGSDPNTLDNLGRTPLMWAVQQGNIPMIDLMLENGADINYPEINGQTPLHISITEGSMSVLKHLQKKGASLFTNDIQGNSTLHLAAMAGWKEGISYLLEQKININEPDVEGKTALFIPIEQNDWELASFLIDKGADINALDSSSKNCLHWAIACEAVDTAKMLIEEGINYCHSDGVGSTPLHEACFTGIEEIVSTILEKGVDPNCRNSNGVTPLHWASHNGFVEIIELLVKHGGDVNALECAQKQTPKDYAILGGQPECAKKLSDFGGTTVREIYDESAIIIQCCARQMLARKHMAIMKENRRLKQIEDEKERKRLQEALELKSAIKLQCYIRMQMALKVASKLKERKRRLTLLKQNRCARIIQKYAKAFLWKAKFREFHIVPHEAAFPKVVSNIQTSSRSVSKVELAQRFEGSRQIAVPVDYSLKLCSANLGLVQYPKYTSELKDASDDHEKKDGFDIIPPMEDANGVPIVFKVPPLRETLFQKKKAPKIPSFKKIKPAAKSTTPEKTTRPEVSAKDATPVSKRQQQLALETAQNLAEKQKKVKEEEIKLKELRRLQATKDQELKEQERKLEELKFKEKQLSQFIVEYEQKKLDAALEQRKQSHMMIASAKEQEEKEKRLAKLEIRLKQKEQQEEQRKKQLLEEKEKKEKIENDKKAFERRLEDEKKRIESLKDKKKEELLIQAKLRLQNRLEQWCVKQHELYQVMKASFESEEQKLEDMTLREESPDLIKIQEKKSDVLHSQLDRNEAIRALERKYQVLRLENKKQKSLEACVKSLRALIQEDRFLTEGENDLLKCLRIEREEKLLKSKAKFVEEEINSGELGLLEAMHEMENIERWKDEVYKMKRQKLESDLKFTEEKLGRLCEERAPIKEQKERASSHSIKGARMSFYKHSGAHKVSNFQMNSVSIDFDERLILDELRVESQDSKKEIPFLQNAMKELKGELKKLIQEHEGREKRERDLKFQQKKVLFLREAGFKKMCKRCHEATEAKSMYDIEFDEEDALLEEERETLVYLQESSLEKDMDTNEQSLSRLKKVEQTPAVMNETRKLNEELSLLRKQYLKLNNLHKAMEDIKGAEKMLEENETQGNFLELLEAKHRLQLVRRSQREEETTERKQEISNMVLAGKHHKTISEKRKDLKSFISCSLEDEDISRIQLCHYERIIHKIKAATYQAQMKIEKEEVTHSVIEKKFELETKFQNNILELTKSAQMILGLYHAISSLEYNGKGDSEEEIRDIQAKQDKLRALFKKELDSCYETYYSQLSKLSEKPKSARTKNTGISSTFQTIIPVPSEKEGLNKKTKPKKPQFAPLVIKQKDESTLQKLKDVICFKDLEIERLMLENNCLRRTERRQKIHFANLGKAHEQISHIYTYNKDIDTLELQWVQSGVNSMQKNTIVMQDKIIEKEKMDALKYKQKFRLLKQIIEKQSGLLNRKPCKADSKANELKEEYKLKMKRWIKIEREVNALFHAQQSASESEWETSSEIDKLESKLKSTEHAHKEKISIRKKIVDALEKVQELREESNEIFGKFMQIHQRHIEKKQQKKKLLDKRQELPQRESHSIAH
eukprot:Nk52_evm107s914 gene=Nk52_evmTU107s914